MNRVLIRCNKLSVLLLKKLNELNGLSGFDMYVGSSDNADILTPCPWDAWIDIKDDEDGVEQLIIEGGAGASGFGYCKVVVPLKEADMYTLDIRRDKGDLPKWVTDLA